MALPDEKDTLKKGPEDEQKIEVVIENEPADAAAVDVVDDTPEADRGRKPLPEGEAEPTEEEMAEYSEAVKKRISKMRHGLHDERRAKEAATRERDEAITAAQRLLQEKRALEQRFVQGEDALIHQTKEKVDLAMTEAKREYKAAYELGDADAMADAQEKIASLAQDRKQTEGWAQQAGARKAESARQAAEPVVQSAQSSQVQAPAPDADAVSWAAKNKWFGQDKVMTATAYGVHDELIAEGINPVTEPSEYYHKLNSRMREVFPKHEWGDAPKRKTTSVVAPVTRTSKTATRVTLTQSQVAVARRLGLTPMQYAVELAKLEK